METTNTRSAGVTTTIDREDAMRLLGLAGCVRCSDGGYVLDGERYWSLDEALMVALTDIADCNGISEECWDENR